MFNRNRGLRQVGAIASISLVAGCGMFSDGDPAEGGPIVVGTTSAPSTLDPAASWDGSWELFRNIYQTLLSYPSGATSPQPDAAQSCEFTDSTNRVYRCELREGLTFSDGDAVDAQAVKHSIDRILAINAPGGPAGLLGSLDRVQAVGDREVVFHLKTSDATFPFVLATPAMSVVDPDDYPADRLREDGGVTGSGPYALDSYDEGARAELVRNDSYKGFAERRNDAVTIRYFDDSAAMVQALRDQDIDLTYRGLAADDIVALQGGADETLQLVEGAGVDISYLVFNPKDEWAAKPAVRKAIAQLVDRATIAHKIYKDTVDPLYSMVPKGLTGHTTGFFDDYGDPDPDKARTILTEAGITDPVPLTFWYTTDRYGSETAVLFKELERQLEASGLFEITLKSRDTWKTYAEGYQKGEYPVFGRGWFPDFPDADNYIAPFVGEQNALGTPYPAPKITEELLPRSRRESDRAQVEADFEEAQEILVRDARLLPLWQGKQYVAASEEIAGAERALDPSTIMMVWELYRKTSW
ncbi:MULTISPECIES: ABC transporter substrate-binding protein [Streptomyces]|uniref:ABC transporter substrate-binding protein n=1 Tax=Streptomyces TaxID=1883 RepID=UPI00148768F7|nr:ABC transporter substrate-binding protein [Streptomyces sp. Z423-1]